MKKQPSLIGGACIIASVCVGAGMLGLPSAGAGAWTIWSLFAITLTMAVMTLSGWLLLEAFQHYDIRVSFDSVTSHLLGEKINFINNLAVYFVGCILLYAYTTSSGLIISQLLHINSKIAAILFILIFSAIVWYSTKAVSRISVILIAFMLLSFIFSISGMSMQIKPAVLFDSLNPTGEYTLYIMALLPVALTSFGYHHSVASMRIYYGEEKKAQQAILGGTAIALFFYAVWLISIFGNLPREQFLPVIAQGGNIDVLLAALGSVIDSKQVSHAVNAFSMAAILSSFIGVGLGLFDFLADFFKFDDSKKGRSKTWSVTFLPPLVMSILFPFGFVAVIGYAGAVATIWACIIPALLARAARKRYPDQSIFNVIGGNITVYLVIVFGVLVALFHILAMLGKLPVFS
ncbi:tryptophan-specific transport protein [Pasteurella testudinis DSM 23072]|uniref:Aromatic amino acid permease n=1 Tax=Pasteurella testudinis DSM 23072 TaxID=1122938 RepID=A0A1W1UNQ6_9PAST|nr:aromatic amino acid transport family protein [Pasteurella testudinis]SMB82755.1 tryptophan-specific transport protein [Pasteurella testudinis DSM 23072]SUB52739.1 tryptophan-specific transport protein-1 [Pasteurella testudinis]